MPTPPLTTITKSLHERAIEAIIQATDAAMRNEQGRVKMLVHEAKVNADLIARKMKAMGMHKQAQEYVKALTEHINRVWSISQKRASENSRDLVAKAKKAKYEIRKAEKCDKCGELKKEGACQCSFLQKSFHPFKDGDGKASLGIGVNPRHDYKMLHELSPSHQKAVTKKYSGGDHSRYAYPVHKETGELIHAQRVPLPPAYAMRARAQQLNQLKPEHRRGSFVEIDAPEHVAHGKKGVVLPHNPNIPGKVGVQIGPTENHAVWMEPHQIRISRAITRMEKALQTIVTIRKAFLK